MTGRQRTAAVGLKLKYVADIKKYLSLATELEYGFICTTIIPESKVVQQLNGSMDITEPFSWNDMTLDTIHWQRGVVGIISNLEAEFQGPNDKMIKRAANILYHQLSFCHHLRIPAIVIELTKNDCANLANYLNNKLVDGTKNQYTVPYHSYSKYWIKVPMASSPQTSNPQDITDPWNVWNTFRLLCSSEKLLYVVLELSADVPEEDELERWLGEPVKAIFLHTDVFQTNGNGYPVLSKAHQIIIKRFLLLNVQIIIDAEFYSEDLKFYQQYIQHISSSLGELQDSTYTSEIAAFAAGYEDVLQIPLQPLKDNLESGTYEVFERDPIKYRLYEEAIRRAIMDKVPEEERNSTKLVVMVVGAGRGPLVRASLKAAELAGVDIKVYAVEKNANAANTLFHALKDEELWKSKVTVVCKDMRVFQPTEKADIIVSELLGSFADNELSPECLDGAQRFLKEGGIMIPKNYTSFIAPIMSSKVHQDVAGTADPDKPKHAPYETLYVIHLKNKYNIAETKKLFTFEHPNYDTDLTNDRYGVRKFTSKQDCLLHGFAGYFESVLYGDILMSIHPPTHSPGMLSWFPMFIPLREPLQIKTSQEIVVNFWRKSSTTEVWYEWAVTSPACQDIHNPNGRSFTMRL